MARARRLAITLLGAPRVTRDGEVVNFDTRKAMGLLAYVAVAGRQRRDSLAALLWPDADDQRARGALRRTLSVLNSGIGDGWLRIERDSVELDAARVTLDLRRFEELIAAAADHGDDPVAACARCRRDLRAAVGLYGGDFLAGFALRDSPAFDDWQYFEAEGRRRDLAGALDRLADLELAAGDTHAAIAHARRRLGIDPLHEPAQRSLMLLYARTGGRAAAVRQYRECIRVLDDELAVAPLPETTRLYESIVAGEVSPESSPSVAIDAPGLLARPARAGDLLLVGRSDELDQLLAAHHGATNGLLLTIEGGPGMGKTRLVDELAARLRDGGAPALVIRCRDGEANAGFGGLLSGLRARLQAGGGWPERLAIGARRVLASVIPNLAEEVPTVPWALPTGTGGSVLDALVELLAVTLHESRPGMLIIDDVDGADPTMLDFLDATVARLGRTRLHAVLSHRPLQSDTAGTDAGLRIAKLVATAAASVETLAIRLPALSAADIVELARAMGVRDAPAVGARLAAESDGSPLAVRHYLDAIRLGDLRVADAEWQLPGGARGLLRTRIDALEPVSRQVLGATAVLGDAFAPEIAREVSGRGDDEVVGAIEQLVERGFLREPEAGDTYRFVHRQVRDVALESMSHARIRLLHARSAAALQQRQRVGSSRLADAARIAAHLAAAGQEQEAAAFHVQAAEAARRAFAHADAVEHYRAALALGGGDQATIHAAIGDVETVRGRYGEALLAFERAAAHARVDELPALEHRLGTLQLRIGAWRMASQHLSAALDAWPRDDRSGRARVLADFALAEHRFGMSQAAAGHAGEAVRLSHASGDPVVRAQAHNLRAILARAAGDLHTARNELELALSMASRVADPSVRVAVLNNAALVERDAGDLQRAIGLTDEALALCVAIGERHREAALRNNRADLLHLLGRREASVAELAKSVAIFAEVGEPGRMQPEIWKLVEW